MGQFKVCIPPSVVVHEVAPEVIRFMGLTQVPECRVKRRVLQFPVFVGVVVDKSNWAVGVVENAPKCVYSLRRHRVGACPHTKDGVALQGIKRLEKL